MFGRHLRLLVDVELGVVADQPRHDLEGWVSEHHRRLSQAYQLAHNKMTAAARHKKLYNDQKAKANALLPGERVWVRDRNRRDQGKLHSWWEPVPHVIVDLVGDSGLVYHVRPERGGKERTLHRNALKPCIAPTNCLLNDEPQTETQTPELPVMLYYPVVNLEPGQERRRSDRATRGQCPARYRD